jgi:hypothetical protein
LAARLLFGKMTRQGTPSFDRWPLRESGQPGKADGRRTQELLDAPFAYLNLLGMYFIILGIALAGLVAALRAREKKPREPAPSADPPFLSSRNEPIRLTGGETK